MAGAATESLSSRAFGRSVGIDNAHIAGDYRHYIVEVLKYARGEPVKVWENVPSEKRSHIGLHEVVEIRVKSSEHK